MPFLPTELILNPGGSIYHLHLRPEQIAPTVFLVGDPDRVPMVSKHFDEIEHRERKREFITHTGRIGKARLTVISTGIGPDNIDIVLNELDAAVNIDFETRTVKEKLTSLRLIRLGTSGSLQRDIPVDSMVVSALGIGMDNLLSFYRPRLSREETKLKKAFNTFLKTLKISKISAVAAADPVLLKLLSEVHLSGITLTCPGFYAPQGRSLRAKSALDKSFFERVSDFQFEGNRITNFEMETAAIYGLARLLGHRALSCNAIIANRQTGGFSKNPQRAVEDMIERVLDKVSG